MNNDFKKSSYLLTFLFFFIGVIALVGVSAAKYFTFDELVVTVCQIVSLLSFFIMFINCVYSKSKYNSACIRFADYLIANRRKEAERRAADNERMKEMQNIRAAAEKDREKAVAAALQQGRSEGAQSAGFTQTPRQAAPAPAPVQQNAMPMPQQMPVQQNAMPMPQQMPQAHVQPPAPVQTQNRMPVAPVAPVAQPVAPVAPVAQPVAQPVPQRIPQPAVQKVISENREPVGMPNEEVLYNEYGEPVMVRRRVRKSAFSPDGEMLYDSHGNPVIRRNQGLWEPLEQRHEIVVKVETAPGMTVSQPSERDHQQ